MSAYPNKTLAEDILFIQDMLEHPEPRTPLEVAQSLHWCNGNPEGQRAAKIKAQRSLDTLVELKWATVEDGRFSLTVEPFRWLRRFADLQRQHLADLHNQARLHFENLVQLNQEDAV